LSLFHDKRTLLLGSKKHRIVLIRDKKYVRCYSGAKMTESCY